MPSDDLKNYATSDTDFYELLGITFENSQKDIDRAWRRTALKYHPDKVGNDPVAKEKFHLAQIGYDLLSDPVVKVLYDNTRNARLQRKRQNELFAGKRRKMKDDLEARERGVKREREEEEGDEEKLEREIRRLAEDGKRRRKEREEALRKDIQQDTKPSNGLQPSSATNNSTPNNGAAMNRTGVSEIDRTIKVRWPQSETTIGESQIKALFSKFGPIESADLLAPKMLKTGPKPHKKQLVATCMIQYTSIMGAHAAVEDFPHQRSEEWTPFDSVFWAANKAPDFLPNTTTTTTNSQHPNSSPATPLRTTNPRTFLDSRNDPSTPSTASHDGLRKRPSFASFAAAVGSPALGVGGRGSGSPSLEEMTMIRLKNAEKKRLVEEMRRREEEEDKEAGGGGDDLG